MTTLTVLIEYDPLQKRVIVRGAGNQLRILPKLRPQNQQNYVEVFPDTDMGDHVGFTGLIPDDRLHS